MSIEAWLLFVLTDTVLCFTPGPAVLFVVSTALTHGASPGLRASVGIVTMNLFYFLLSATGIGAILLASWELFVLIKWIGAAYLICLGLSMLLARRQAVDEAADETATSRTARACASPKLHPRRSCSLRPLISVMQSTDARERHDLSGRG